MTKTIYMMKGLPASGKTTWAKELCAKKETVRRVNMDDIRSMLGVREFNKKDEQIVKSIRMEIILKLLGQGYSVVDDNCNLHPDNERRLRALANSTIGGEFKIIDFTNEPLKTCLIRDAKRKKPVGVQAIKGMYNAYIDKGRLRV